MLLKKHLKIISQTSFKKIFQKIKKASRKSSKKTSKRRSRRRSRKMKGGGHHDELVGGGKNADPEKSSKKHLKNHPKNHLVNAAQENLPERHQKNIT